MGWVRIGVLAFLAVPQRRVVRLPGGGMQAREMAPGPHIHARPGGPALNAPPRENRRLRTDLRPLLGWLGVAYLVIAAAGRLAYAIPLLVGSVPGSAGDLRYRFVEVARWFSGERVYGVLDGAVYPPASHLILWPLLGWGGFDVVRVIWLATTLASAFVIGLVVWRACAPAVPRERLLVSGLVLAAYPLQQAIYMGQMSVHVVGATLVGAMLLFHRSGNWWTDALAAVAFGAALVKPTLSVPLVAAVLVAAGRIRPAVLTGLVYGGLTLAAAMAQPDGLPTLVRDWFRVSGEGVPFMGGVPNVHMLLTVVELDAWRAAASLTLLGLLVAWLWRHRTADPWVLLGVAGVVARLWAHSTLYDDIFLLLPVLALFRTVWRKPRTRWPFGIPLLAAGWAALLTPTWAMIDLGQVVRWTLHVGHSVVWLAVLLFLMVRAAPGSRLHPPAQ